MAPTEYLEYTLITYLCTIVKNLTEKKYYYGARGWPRTVGHDP